jgi:integrase
MPRSRSLVPPYLHHAASGQARTRVRLVDGRTRDLYLGAFNSPVFREEYRRVVELVARHGGVYPPVAAADVTLAEALVRYLREADGRYRDAEGRPTRSLDDVRRMSRLLRTHADPAEPLATLAVAKLKAVQHALAGKYVRVQVNKWMTQFRLFIRWLFLEDYLPLEQKEKLVSVPGLRSGRAGVREGKGRRAADPDAVEKVLPLLPPALTAAVQAIRWSGARPSEILTMRAADLDTSGDVWKLTPIRRKGAWRGNPRWPSHMERNVRKRRGSRARDAYDVNSARRALKAACRKAGVKFTLYELRHLRAAELFEFGNVELARATLGHTHAAMTGHYARAADDGLAA